jgi:hypothetical protein
MWGFEEGGNVCRGVSLRRGGELGCSLRRGETIGLEEVMR